VDSKFVGNDRVIMCLYVDGILIIGTSMNVINETKLLLAHNFDMEDLRGADVTLGFKIQQMHERIGISHYIEKVLKRFSHFDCKSVSAPFSARRQLVKNIDESVAQWRAWASPQSPETHMAQPHDIHLFSRIKSLVG